MGSILIWLVIGLTSGGICAALASSRGRNTVGWFFIGLALAMPCHIFGAIGAIILLVVLPDLKQEHSRREFDERERHRLREQLRQERLKNEAFRQYTAGRLDSHDEVLGVDTRSAQTALPGGSGTSYQLANLQQGSALQPADQLARSLDAQPDRARWYYEEHGQSAGPVKASEIRAMLASGQLTWTSLLWGDGMVDWQQIRLVPEFQQQG